MSGYSVVELRELLGRLEALLTQAGLAHALIGGVAVSCHGQRARTRDIDVLVAGTSESLDQLRTLAQAQGWRPERIGAWHLRLWSDRQYADVLLAEVELQTETIDEATILNVAGVPIPVASPVHLSALKLLARRPRDLRDVAEINERYPDLDVARVNRLLAPFELRWQREPGEIVPTLVELAER